MTDDIFLNVLIIMQCLLTIAGISLIVSFALDSQKPYRWQDNTWYYKPFFKNTKGKKVIKLNPLPPRP